MSNIVWTLSLVALAMFLIMGRMIYVLLRQREDSDRWDESLRSAIYKAGWMEEYKRACVAAREDIIVRRHNHRHATK